ncbi:MAG: hypothetical protein QOF27_3021 [Gaiellaceae bacterium]|jgi:hypothetical protein|nr:hypothetical protein [Gaiellaceae bacterium]
MHEQYLRERLDHGWIELHKDGRGVWTISWVPDPGSPDHPRRTHSPFDVDLPDGYPRANEPEALLTWGRALWGGA